MQECVPVSIHVYLLTVTGPVPLHCVHMSKIACNALCWLLGGVLAVMGSFLPVHPNVRLYGRDL